MRELPSFRDDPNLLIGAEHFSDAGVYRLSDSQAMVQSTDFFSPIVNDPYVFGQVAAANAMSDVFAMGGTVRTALNIVCFPDNVADLSILTDILKGGAERVLQAGGVILGGHSIRDEEIKYGLAVTGIVHPDKVMSNAGAQPGDVLLLSKALGTGFVTTAHRYDKCSEDVLDAAIASMIQLNNTAAQLAQQHCAHAATDITGFGLAGHAYEMAVASNVNLEIKLGLLPLLRGAFELAEAGNLTRANSTNHGYVESSLTVDSSVNLESTQSAFLFDPQTSGGLLIASPPDQADALIADYNSIDSSSTLQVIGQVREFRTSHLHII